MSAQDPPAEEAARKRTPSFLCELPRSSDACLGEAKRHVGLVRESKAFQRARALPKDDPARRTLFREARVASACSEYALHAYADQLRQSWLGEHLDSNTCQKLATRGYQTANRLLLGKARRVRFKGRHQLDTVEGEALLQPFCPEVAPETRALRQMDRKLDRQRRANAQRDLYSAYLARFVDPDTSLLEAGQARDTWPGREPVLQAEAISNQPACVRVRAGRLRKVDQPRTPSESPGDAPRTSHF